MNLIDTADGNGKGVAGFTSSGAGENKEGTVGRGIGDGDRDSRDTGDGRRPSPSELERINAWAYAGEVVLHGTPSGLDNTVSCYGGAIKFVKGMDGAKNVTEVCSFCRPDEARGCVAVGAAVAKHESTNLGVGFLVPCFVWTAVFGLLLLAVGRWACFRMLSFGI